MDIKIICFNHGRRRGQVRKAIDILNSVQNYFYFSLKFKSGPDVCESELINWNEFCESYEIRNGDKFEIFITEKAFDDNWFSHEHHQYAIISTNDWEESFSPPPLNVYIVYQIAQIVINFEADLREFMELNMVHLRPRGCIFDFCGDKNDIKLGMLSGAICSKCRIDLRTYGVVDEALEAVEKILSYVRLESRGRPVVMNANRAFVVMRFSTNNDENKNSYLYGIKSALTELNIDFLRADDEINTAPIFNQVVRNIKENRFIIVKVDSNNLNVYFELGLAMGLGKDVLLIAEEGFIPQLPTDLNNWECLTYPKGDYEELKEKIIKYYKSHYHR